MSDWQIMEKIRGGPHPGALFGVRAPAAGETPLSDYEIKHGLDNGIFSRDEFDDDPVRRVFVPLGGWGLSSPHLVAKATPWDALT